MIIQAFMSAIGFFVTYSQKYVEREYDMGIFNLPCMK